MKKERKKFNKEEAIKNVNELLEKHEFRCVLAVTDSGMVLNGGGEDFLAILSMVIHSAIRNIGIPEELVRRAVEVGFETDEDEDEEKENLTEDINKKMIEILDLMKEKLTK